MIRAIPTLELCKQMKEKGWPQEAHQSIADLAWYHNTQTNECSLFWYRGESLLEWVKICTAPSVVDLGNALPSRIEWGETIHESAQLYMSKENDKWTIVYMNILNGVLIGRQETESEADGRAAMWIFLKENGFI